MGRVEAIIKSEIVRLAKREIRKITFPLGRDVRALKGFVSQLRRTVSELQRFAALQKKELEKKEIPLQANPEEVKMSRFSPRLIRSLRRRLGITQKELALLTGVTVGAIHQWESGIFKPTMKKKEVIVALRKLRRREVRKLIEEKNAEIEKKVRTQRSKVTKKRSRK